MMLSLAPSLRPFAALQPWGTYRPYFVGRPQTEWLEDGRSMEMLADFEFYDSRGKRWVAPQGRIVDGHSIPWVLVNPLVGTPFTGKGRESSVIHDVACQDKTEPWQDVHRAYHEGLRARGMSLPRAWIYYRCVYVGGPRWPRPEEVR